MPRRPQGRKRPAAIELLAIAIGALLIASTSVSQPGALARPMTVASGLNSVDQRRLHQLIAQHRQAKARMPLEQVVALDRISREVRSKLFSEPEREDLLQAATEIINRTIPGLSQSESESLAEYALNEIASEGSGMGVGMGTGTETIGAAAGEGSQSQLMAATQQMQEAQMSFNLQYLQLQSQMQNENRQYTAVSNIMKTKHDTVKNSISNVR
jgi:hypothetical protein